MSPRQCGHNGRATSSDDDTKNEWNTDAVGGMLTEPPAAARNGDVHSGWAALELLRFAVEQMNAHADWVYRLETTDDRDTRRLVLDVLVDMSHVGHHFLRHDDQNVRDAAEMLTTGTAYLIGRMYNTFGTDTSLMR